MPRPRPSLHADFVGWTAEDFMAGAMIELRKLNMRQAGVDNDLIDDVNASPDDLLIVMELTADVRQKFLRKPDERVGVAGAIAQLQAEKAKPRT